MVLSTWKDNAVHCLAGSSIGMVLLVRYGLVSFACSKKQRTQAHKHQELLASLMKKMSMTNYDIRLIDDAKTFAESRGFPCLQKNLAIVIGSDNIGSDDVEFILAHKLAQLQNNNTFKLIITTIVSVFLLTLMVAKIWPQTAMKWPLWRTLIFGPTCRASLIGMSGSLAILPYYSWILSRLLSLRQKDVTEQLECLDRYNR